MDLCHLEEIKGQGLVHTIGHVGRMAEFFATYPSLSCVLGTNTVMTNDHTNALPTNDLHDERIIICHDKQHEHTVTTNDRHDSYVDSGTNST